MDLCNPDGLVTSGVVQDLIEKLNQMNETVQQQARIIEKLQGTVLGGGIDY